MLDMFNQRQVVKKTEETKNQTIRDTIWGIAYRCAQAGNQKETWP